MDNYNFNQKQCVKALLRIGFVNKLKDGEKLKNLFLQNL